MGHPGGLGGLVVPPCTHHPTGWAWSCQGIPSQSPGMLEQSIPHVPASLGTRGEAAGGSPRAGSASRTFPRAGKSPKKLQSSNSDSQGWLSLGAGKGGAQAGMGMSPEHRWHPAGSLSSDCTKVPPPLPNLSLFQLSRSSAFTADNLQAHVKPPSTVSLIIPSINDKSHSFQGSHYEFIPLFNVLTSSRHPTARREILNNPFRKSQADTAGAILDSGREMGKAGGIGL